MVLGDDHGGAGLRWSRGLCVPPGAAAGGRLHPGGEESEEGSQPASGVEHDGV